MIVRLEGQCRPRLREHQFTVDIHEVFTAPLLSKMLFQLNNGRHITMAVGSEGCEASVAVAERYWIVRKLHYSLEVPDPHPVVLHQHQLHLFIPLHWDRPLWIDPRSHIVLPCEDVEVDLVGLLEFGVGPPQ